jgi:hypothetical protein
MITQPGIVSTARAVGETTGEGGGVAETGIDGVSTGVDVGVGCRNGRWTFSIKVPE